MRLKPSALLLVFYGIIIGTSSYSSFNLIDDDDDDEEYGSLGDNSTKKIDVNCSVWYRREFQSSDLLHLRVSSPSSSFHKGDFLLLRLHTFSHPVILFASLDDADDPATNANGTDVGMVRLISSQGQELSWYFQSSSASTTFNYTVLFRVDLYPSTAPIPGGCNVEFSPEFAPQIDTSIVDRVLMKATFQPAATIFNDSMEPCTQPYGDAGIRYSVFMYALPIGDLTFDAYASALALMSSPAKIRGYGFRVMTLPSRENRDLRFFWPVLKTQGILVAIVAENALGRGGGSGEIDNFTASYVSTVNYGCDVTDESTCYTRYALSTYFFLPALLLFGFVSAFLGHHLFRVHLALYSFLCFGFLAILVVGDLTQLSLANTAYFAAGVGCLGSLLMLWFWWYTGFPLPSVVASGLVLGYLVASVVVTIPYIHRQLLEVSHQGQAAVFGVISVTPLFFLYWARGLNILSTSICGSYVAFASLDLFLDTSRLSQILWQSILWNVFPERVPLLLRVGPVSTIDMIVISFCVVVALLGLYFQWQREKSNPPFPPHRNLTKNVVEGQLERLEATPSTGVTVVRGIREEVPQQFFAETPTPFTLGFPRRPRRPIVRDADGNVALLPSSLRPGPNYGAMNFRRSSGAAADSPSGAATSNIGSAA